MNNLLYYCTHNFSSHFKEKGNNNVFCIKVMLKFKFGTNLEFFFDLELFENYSINFALYTY